MTILLRRRPARPARTAGVVAETAAWSFLIILGLVAARNARDGTLGVWLRSKFLNAGAAPVGDLPQPGASGRAAKLLAKGATTSGLSAGPGSSVATGAVGGGGRLADPAPGARTGDGFGVPRSGGRTHKGIDLIGPRGSAIRAAEAGKISTFRLTLCGVGANVNHGGGLSTDYCHMSRYAVPNGAQVRKGQVIGDMGSSGTSGGPHLHFEVNVNGREVDPAPYIGR